ncbi:MAG: hypothetical protein JSV70_03895 [bacterium]|nr:MAG: hypothetical protein JSV70_03895 [bacterium]
MLELDLDRDEREILADVLETRLADLRMEIGRTSRLAYRDMLRKKKRVLEKAVACLRGEKVRDTGSPGLHPHRF